MKLIDTHAHLQFEKFDTDRQEVVKRNSEKLLAVINPGADLDSSARSIKLAQEVLNFYAAVGVHPHHVANWNDTYLPVLEDLISQDKVVAVGEIGLDKYRYQGYPEPDVEKQKAILRPQIVLALKHKKPILFHCREAYDELYEVIKDYPKLTGLIHCFMGDFATAEKFLDMGLYISFAGNLTYKANDLMREAVRQIPANRLLVETDSPYLAPENLRGSRNEPVNVLFVVETIAREKNLSFEQVGEFTVANAKKLFKI